MQQQICEHAGSYFRLRPVASRRRALTLTLYYKRDLAIIGQDLTNFWIRRRSAFFIDSMLQQIGLL